MRKRPESLAPQKAEQVPPPWTRDAGAAGGRRRAASSLPSRDCVSRQVPAPAISGKGPVSIGFVKAGWPDIEDMAVRFIVSGITRTDVLGAIQ